MNLEIYTVTALLAYLKVPANRGHEVYYKFGKVPQALATAIDSASGLNVTDFEVVIDRSGIQHTFKQHGLRNAPAEIAQGQIPIGDADFEALPSWLLKPERVLPGKFHPNKMPCVELQATSTTGEVRVVLEYRPGRRRLVLQTMYKKRPTA